MDQGSGARTVGGVQEFQGAFVVREALAVGVDIGEAVAPNVAQKEIMGTWNRLECMDLSSGILPGQCQGVPAAIGTNI